MFVALVIVVMIWVVAETTYRHWLTSRGIRKITYEPALPLCGNALAVAKTKNLTELHNALLSYLPDQPISGFWIFNKLMIMVNEPSYTEELLIKTSCSHKAEELYNMFSDMASGIFLRNGHNWAKMRKPLNKVMHAHKFQDWVEKFILKAEEMSELMKEDETTNLENLASRCTLEIILETHMGINDAKTMEGIDEYIEDVTKGVETVFMGCTHALNQIRFLYYRSYKWKELEKVIRCTHGFIKRVLEESQRKPKQHAATESQDPSNYADLALRIAKGENANETETFKLVIDFLIAGSDTTSTTMTSAILFLAMHPNYQEKIQEELRAIFGDSVRAPTLEDITRMDYLEMVINETLRLVGVPGVARRLKENVDLDGYQLPKNAILFFRFMNICRDGRWWKRPNEFYPDHFLPEAVSQRPRGAFTPFSRGQRACPGKMFAMISLKVMLSIMLRRYEFTTHLRFQDIKYKYGFMQTPELREVRAARRPLHSKIRKDPAKKIIPGNL